MQEPARVNVRPRASSLQELRQVVLARSACRPRTRVRRCLMKPGILFLDVDGVVRRGHQDDWKYVNGPDDVIVFPGAVDFMREWKSRNPMNAIVAVSNQPAISIGHTTEESTSKGFEETNRQCGGLFDFMLWCAHWPDNDGPCRCRKPRPGMIYTGLDLVRRSNGTEYSLVDCLMIGDRVTDKMAAKAAAIDFDIPWWSERSAELRSTVLDTQCATAPN